jgi:predicted transcriptional regulator
MPSAQHPFVLSIRPTFIQRILAGEKTIELRRRFPTAIAPDSSVLLYSTSPVQSIVGIAHLEAVSHLTVRQLWQRFGRASAVTRAEFDAYFQQSTHGFALHLRDVRPFSHPIHLTDLARRFEFSPPQSYCYWKEPLSKLAAHGRDQTLT